MRISLIVLQAKQDIQQAKVDLVAAQKRRQQLEVYEVYPSLVRAGLLISLSSSACIVSWLFPASASVHARMLFFQIVFARQHDTLKLLVSK